MFYRSSIFLENDFLEISSKFSENEENEKSLEGSKNTVGLRRHSTSPPCGNLVDGLPHDCHNTETVAKPGRLGPAQNDELMQNFIELTIFWSMFEEKTPRKCCQECIEDLEKYIKI